MQTVRAPDAAAAGALASAGQAQIAQFFIPAAASLQERRPRTLKHGDTFGLFDHNGDILSGPGSPEGLFHRDTRYLSHFYLTISGARPLLLSSIMRDDNATLTCDLTNPDLYDAKGRLVLEHDLIHIRRWRFIWNGACLERLSLRNFDTTAHRITLAVDFAADFADIFEARGAQRQRRGRYHEPVVEAGAVRLAYTGLDETMRQTSLRFEPHPSELSSSRATFEIELGARDTKVLYIEIGCGGAIAESPLRRTFLGGLKDSRRALRNSASRATAIVTSNDVFNEGVRRAVSDLYMLITDKPEGPFPYAGVPWFSTVFGRDALITAHETLWLDPAIARGVLRHLAANQATEEDPTADAEPGKILHEVRYGEMAETGEVPFRCYYGSVDSTPLFLLLAGAYFERTGDTATLRELWPNIEAALSWIDEYGDRDGDGFVEYGRRNAQGLINQGWKDSHDSVFHSDGTLAQGPIALVEVQAYVYGAWQAAALIARHLGHESRAQELERRAAVLRRRFDDVFFDDELGTYVLGLDGQKRPCRVRTSNAGHALFAGIAYPERAKQVGDSLMSARSFSGWGIRTLAVGEPRYNPMSYHNGSVWPHENALIAIGLARYDMRAEAARIFQGMFAASMYIDLRRLPELFCGFPRQRSQGPTFYPVACSPQAWAAAAPLALLQACLGIGFEPRSRRVIFTKPVLPSFCQEVVLRGLKVAEGSVDVAVKGTGREVSLSVLDRKGDALVQTLT
jgi:glycogen debranching enzyme